MTIMYSEFPSSALAPLFGIELNRVAGEPSAPEGRIVAFGQKLSTGTATAATLYQITSIGLAEQLFGRASQLARTCRAILTQAPSAPLWAVGLADDSGGTASVHTITVTGTATADGVITIYAAGQKVTVNVTEGDAQNTIGAAVRAALTAAVATLPFTVGGSTNTAVLTCRHKGDVGNQFAIRFSHRGLSAGEELPAGVSISVARGTDGSGDPDVADAFAAIAASDVATVICGPWVDDTSLDTIQAAMEDRWSPQRNKGGHYYTAAAGSHSALVSAGNGRTTDSHVTWIGLESDTPAPSYEVLGLVVGAIFQGVRQNPAVPFTGTLLKRAASSTDPIALASAAPFSWDERNTLLAAGVTPIETIGGRMVLSRTVTLYKTNPSTGMPDTKFRDVQTLHTLDQFVQGAIAMFAAKYTAAVIVPDGQVTNDGVPAVRPGDIRASLLAYYQDKSREAWVQDLEGFADALVVEVNADNSRRIDFLAPLRLTAPLYQLAGQITAQVGG